MTKFCLQCGEKVGFLRRDGFCSSEHSEAYHQERSMAAFQRLLGIEAESVDDSTPQLAGN
jgi:hypothetical protein